MSEEPNLVEVEWAGRKLFLHQDKLDEWYAKRSDEQKVEYINSHPDIRGPVSVHRMKERNALQHPDDLVLVKWSGHKVLLMEREQLDEWYHSSFEDHCEFVKKHPESEVQK